MSCLVGLVGWALIAVAGITGEGDGPGLVAEISDQRLVELSGMALSTRLPGVAYVVNDSGNDPVVFSVRVSSGEVVGETTLTGVELVDPEAAAISADGRLLVADIGDNAFARTDVTLLALSQPGRGDGSVQPAVYRVRYADGPANAEALVVDPVTGRVNIVTKAVFGAAVLELPSQLSDSGVQVARPLNVDVPAVVTDGVALPSGRGAVLRTYAAAYVYTLPDWRLVGQRPLPRTEQGETLVAEPGGRSVLIGSEGVPSPIIRVSLPDRLLAALRPTNDPTPDPAPDPSPVATGATDGSPASGEFGRYYAAGGAVTVGLGVVAGLALVRRRRSY